MQFDLGQAGSCIRYEGQISSQSHPVDNFFLPQAIPPATRQTLINFLRAAFTLLRSSQGEFWHDSHDS